jgi:ribonuclease D
MASSKDQLQPPVLISQQSQFQQLLDKLSSEPALAVDTEANSLFAYQEQVCLVQISTPKADFIIDPLALDDLSPLGGLLEDPRIQKVFHASEYDILIMNEQYGFKFRNLFDTMLAAQILGREKLGLDALMEEITGITVNKKYQRANWGKRPLAEDMLRYAQKDTHYLFQIRDALHRELEHKGLMPIAEEDFKRACLAYRQRREDKLAPCWRIQGSRKLTPQKASVLEKLCDYREEVARKLNRPVFKVFSAQILLKLAEVCPTSVAQLAELEIPGKKALQRYGPGLVNAIQAGLNAPPMRPPRKERPDDATLAREKALSDWRKKTARKMDVNSAVVLPRELLSSLVMFNPTTPAEVAGVLAEVPWRLDKFGDEILSVLRRCA